MPLNLPEEIDANVKAMLVGTSQAGEAAKVTAERSAAILQDISKLSTSMATNAAEVTRAQNEGALRAQVSTLKLANAAGVDPNAGMDDLTQILAERRVKAAEVRTGLKEIEQLRSVSFFDGPLDWVGARLKAVRTEGQVQDNLQTTAILTQQANELNNAVQSGAQTQRAIQQTLTQASVDASVNLARTTYEIKAKEAEFEGLKYNQAAVNVARDVSKEHLTTLYAAQNSEESAVRAQATLDSIRSQTEARTFNQRMIAEKAVADADKRDLDEVLQEKINFGLGVLGRPALSGREMKYQLERFKAGGSAELQMAYDIGDKSKQAGVIIIGTTPSESLKALEGANRQVLDDKAELLGLFQEARAVMGTPEFATRTPGFDPKNKDAVNAAFNSTVAGLIKERFSNITPGTGNVFDVGDLKSYVGDGKTPGMGIGSLASLPIAQKVFIPAIQGGQSLADPKIVLGLGLAAVRAGTLTSTEYQQGISQIYQQANLINQQYRNFTGVGIVLPKNGKGYNARIGTNGVLDLTNPTALGNYLAQELPKQVYRDGKLYDPKFVPLPKNLGL